MPPAWPSGACRGVGQPAITAPSLAGLGIDFGRGARARPAATLALRCLDSLGMAGAQPGGSSCCHRASSVRRARPPAGGPACRFGSFRFAAALGGLALGYLWHSHGEVLDALDLASGVVACLALWWRRGYPVAVTLVAFGAAWFSPLALGAALVAIGTAASRARGRALLLVALLAMLGSVVFPLVNPAAGEILKIGFPAFLLTVIAFGWGLYTRARRELVASLRERAARLEADQQHSAEQAREAERRRIAREMHDVLATGFRCSACMPARWNSGRMPRQGRSPRPQP